SELERTSLFFDIGEVHRSQYVRLKRIMDGAGGVAGVVALLLLTPVVAVGNLLANGGPLLYRQVRVGKGGEPFTILKFRTMRPNSDDLIEPSSSRATGAGRWTELDDPRVTPFGRFLRRTHLDEVPQALNIL